MATTIPTYDFLMNLTADDVEQVYSGKHGCMCGCNGKYWTMGKMLTKVLNIVCNDPNVRLQDGYILHIDDKVRYDQTRNYVVYLKQESK